VADFLERAPVVQEFWENVRGIVDMNVESYLSRNFSSLSVSFGCTGGQHRSVFMAEKLAAHIRTRFPAVRLSLTHREIQAKDTEL
jgi:RNase adaptor protein for sRNA GlmZ degradation